MPCTPQHRGESDGSMDSDDLFSAICFGWDLPPGVTCQMIDAMMGRPDDEPQDWRDNPADDGPTPE